MPGAVIEHVGSIARLDAHFSGIGGVVEPPVVSCRNASRSVLVARIPDVPDSLEDGDDLPALDHGTEKPLVEAIGAGDNGQQFDAVLQRGRDQASRIVEVAAEALSIGRSDVGPVPIAGDRIQDEQVSYTIMKPLGTLRTMKDFGLRIGVQPNLRKEFLKVCWAQDKPATQVLREFMRAYVSARIAEHDLGNDAGNKNNRTRER